MPRKRNIEVAEASGNCDSTIDLTREIVWIPLPPRPITNPCARGAMSGKSDSIPRVGVAVRPPRLARMGYFPFLEVVTTVRRVGPMIS